MQYKDFWIRDWEARDRTPAAQLIAQVLAEYGVCGEPEGADRDVWEVETYYQQANGVFWVIEQAGQLVGTAGFYPIRRAQMGSNPTAVEIRKMYLLPEARRQGLGRFLIVELEQEIARRGFTNIYLETATALKEAVLLYEALGYAQLDPSQVETARCDRIYHKHLSQTDRA